MLAIVIIPEGIVYKSILEKWKEIHSDYKVNFIYFNSSIPHITLVSGIDEKYKNQILDILNKILKKTTPFDMYTKGYGMLLLNSPLIYLRWRENISLNKLRNNILNKIIQNKLISNDLIENKEWMSKTTIFYKDLEYNEKLLKIISNIKKSYLSEMKINVNKLAIISYSNNSKEKLIKKIDF